MMTKHLFRLMAITWLALAGIRPLLAQATRGAEGDEGDPFSGQSFDPPRNQQWYESPFLWLGLAGFLLVVFLLLRKTGKRKKRKFMEPRD